MTANINSRLPIMLELNPSEPIARPEKTIINIVEVLEYSDEVFVVQSSGTSATMTASGAFVLITTYLRSLEADSSSDAIGEDSSQIFDEAMGILASICKNSKFTLELQRNVKYLGRYTYHEALSRNLGRNWLINIATRSTTYVSLALLMSLTTI